MYIYRVPHVYYFKNMKTPNNGYNPLRDVRSLSAIKHGEHEVSLSHLRNSDNRHSLQLRCNV